MTLRTSRNQLQNRLDPLFNRHQPDQSYSTLPPTETLNEVPVLPSAPFLQAPPPEERVTISRPVALAVVGYVLLLLLLTLLMSGRLYSWAQGAVLQQSPLAELEQRDAGVLAVPAAADDAAPVVVSDAPASQDTVKEAPIVVPPVNVLLLGTDERPEDTNPARTDTMMLLSLTPETNTARLLSLPRDLWVPLPGLDFTTKINMAYVYGEDYSYPGGGPQLAMDTVSSFIGRPVDYYVRVNFQGFIELVDLIGGIDLVVPHTIHDEEYPTEDYLTELFHLEAGPQHLDGETALKYVRTRNLDDDYARAERQQQVVQAIAEKVLRAGMIPTLVAKFPTLFAAMRSSVDTNLPVSKQIELAQYFSSDAVDNIRRLVLDNRYGEETYSEEGAWILFPNRELIRSELDRFFDDTGNSDGDNGSLASIDPRWVRIEVLNGTGQPNVAARTRDYLESRGWQVVSIDDADRSDYNHTLIVNYGAPPSLIQRLGADLSLQSSPSSLSLDRLTSAATASVDVRIVVGMDMLEQLK